MSDNDVIQRRVEPTLDLNSSVVESGARQPKQDLWDADDDIFKPLLDRIQAEQDAAKNKTTSTTDNFEHAADNPFYHADPLGLVTRGDAPPPEPAPRRRSAVLSPSAVSAKTPVTIRSDAQTMPRVVWGQTQAYGKQLVKFFDSLNKRTQLVLSGAALLAIWLFVTAATGRALSMALFDFDPLYPRNWQMIQRLYEQGSTLQWPFVLFYTLLLVVIPVFGVMIAIKAAPEFRKTIAQFLSPLTWLRNVIYRFIMQRKKPAEMVVERHSYSNGNGKNYHGATFKKAPGADDTTGGSIGGGGSGGGHGKPSWQSGPANTQAFPRAEQGRR